MPIDYERLLAWELPEVEHEYTKRDTILYALGVGYAYDPTDPAQLRFVYEDGLLPAPTLAAVLGGHGFWLKDPATGVDWVRIVHGDQGIVLHRPPPAEGCVIGRTRVTGIVDKGRDKGALVYIERTLTDANTGALLCTLTSTTFCRGDGGFGGPAGPVRVPHPLPERPPDLSCDLPTSPQAALIYRLSGDFNPLHVAPEIARAAGFDRPILHGMATFGVAGHGILRTCCGYDPGRLAAMEGRFSAPVFPGETIRMELWRDGRVVSFRARAKERGVVVLDNGRAEVKA